MLRKDNLLNYTNDGFEPRNKCDDGSGFGVICFIIIAGDKYCCISPGQHCAFSGSTGVPRQCFGTLSWLEQRYDGLEKYEPRAKVRIQILCLLRALLVFIDGRGVSWEQRDDLHKTHSKNKTNSHLALCLHL